MAIRREARERAVQFLFQYDLSSPPELEEALESFWETQRFSEASRKLTVPTWGQPVEIPPPTAEDLAVRLFSDPLVRGTLEHLTELDDHIRKHVKNWDIRRIAVVDRNVLRLAIYEMLYRDDIPPVVSINEAVDIAKRFSTEESGAFVNGVLDKVRSELLRPPRTAK